MKNYILSIALMGFIGLNAQVENKDRIVETETRIINVMEDGEMIEKKIMVKTKKEQEVKTDPEYRGTIDAPRVFPSTKVSKVIYIDDDSDPFYDKMAEVNYSNKDGKRYTFKPTNLGFKIVDGKSSLIIGEARFSNNSDVYILNSNDFPGIGYFKNNKFIIEYYDDNGTLIIEKFKESKF